MAIRHLLIYAIIACTPVSTAELSLLRFAQELEIIASFHIPSNREEATNFITKLKLNIAPQGTIDLDQLQKMSPPEIMNLIPQITAAFSHIFNQENVPSGTMKSVRTVLDIKKITETPQYDVKLRRELKLSLTAVEKWIQFDEKISKFDTMPQTALLLYLSVLHKLEHDGVVAQFNQAKPPKEPLIIRSILLDILQLFFYEKPSPSDEEEAHKMATKKAEEAARKVYSHLLRIFELYYNVTFRNILNQGTK